MTRADTNTWRPLRAPDDRSALALSAADPSSAHPTPFSYVDLRLRRSSHRRDAVSARGRRGTRSRNLDPPGPPDRARRFPTCLALLKRPAAAGSKLRVDDVDTDRCRVHGRVPNGSQPRRPFAGRFACEAGHAGPRVLSMDGPLFPYDPEHQTFVNRLRQQRADGPGHTRHATHARVVSDWTRPNTPRNAPAISCRRESSTSSRAPTISCFSPGLLLIGGTIGRLAMIATAFTVAHSITLALAVLDVVAPPPRIIEPLIALEHCLRRPAESAESRPGRLAHHDRRGVRPDSWVWLCVTRLREMRLPRDHLRVVALLVQSRRRTWATRRRAGGDRAVHRAAAVRARCRAHVRCRRIGRRRGRGSVLVRRASCRALAAAILTSTRPDAGTVPAVGRANR